MSDLVHIEHLNGKNIWNPAGGFWNEGVVPGDVVNTLAVGRVGRAGEWRRVGSEW